MIMTHQSEQSFFYRAEWSRWHGGIASSESPSIGLLQRFLVSIQAGEVFILIELDKKNLEPVASEVGYCVIIFSNNVDFLASGELL